MTIKVMLAALLTVLALAWPSLAPAYDFTPLDTLFDQTVAAKRLPGAHLVVVRDNEVIYQRSAVFGPDTPLPLASASKLMTGLVIMRLVDQGVLSLDDTLDRYYPETKGTPRAPSR